MHIGIDASRGFSDERTGTEEYSYQLIRALAQIDRTNRYTLYVRTPQFTRHNLKFPGNFNFKIIPWPYLWTQGGLALESFIEPPDVLFIPAHTLPLVRRPNLKTVVTIHDLGAEFLPGYHQFPQKLYLNRSTKYAVSKATHLIAVSKSTKKDLITKLHCDPLKISVIYEGFDDSKFKSQKSKLKNKSKKLKVKYGISGGYILFVGTVQPRKNLERLIEAFAKLGSKKELALLIVGKPGWKFKEIYEAPKKFGIEKQVRFLDYVSREDLPLFYQGAVCFVFPSLYEGFGLPVLEAMACGCPVVSSNTSSLPEVVSGAGLLFNPRSSEDIVRNLQLIIDNLQLRSSLAKKGLEQVKKFSWKKCAQETLDVLQNVS